MQFSAFVAIAALAQAAATTPISKVLDLLSGLEAKLVEEKAAAAKTFEEFSEWCEDQAKNFEYEIKTGKNEIENLKATIELETATATTLSAKIDDVSSSLTADNADLKAATEIRAKEAADFAANEKELTEVIDTLERAVGLLEREARKGGAAFLQRPVTSLAQALRTIVDASVLSSADVSKLTALLQDSQTTDADADLVAGAEELGAPAAAVYEGHSASIIETLQDLSEKAQSQLAETRQAETTALHNFELLRQGLDDQVKQGTKDAADAKKALGASGEKKANAEGEHGMSSKELKSDTNGLADLNQDCMTKARNHEAADKSRGEEVEALAAAKKAIAEMSSGAESISYGASSFLQVERTKLTSRSDLVNFEAVRLVRDLARRNGNDAALTQLAQRMAMAVRTNSAGADPFSKVKQLISAMIDRLESNAGADSSQKAYCDKELAESNANRDEHNAAIDAITTKIDQLSSRAAQLKDEVAALSDGLAKLAAFRAEMTKIRQEERAAFVKNKADLEQGIEGVKLGLKVLREYYAKDKAHDAAEGASSSIVGLLEVCESDFTNGLAQAVATEEEAARSYDQTEKENEIEKVTKEQDVAYKGKEIKKLAKSIAEANTDSAQLNTELDAVNEYLKQLEASCIAKAEPYAERKARREAEIAGLKDALEILAGEAVLLQRDHRVLRVARAHRV